MLHIHQLFITLALFAFLPLALAHGHIAKIVIDGKSFAGNTPGENNKPSIIRQKSQIDPVKGAQSKDMTCGQQATKAALVADANPGSEVQVLWLGGSNQAWPHDTGPMLTYLAKCDGNCTSFDTSNAQWFKINEVGKKKNGKWAQKDQMDGTPHTFNLPKTLAAGGYMLRHEIIGLHLATSKGGAEFYPSCAQLNVGGNESGGPQASELVRFPGAYKDDDKGILVPDVFDPSLKYKFPGPAVAAFASDDASGNSSASASSTKSSSAATSSSTSAKLGSSSSSSSVSGKAASSSSSCKSKKRSVQRPRRISRVMRNLNQ